MNHIKMFSKNNPVFFTLLLVTSSIALLYSTLLIDFKDEFNRDIFGSIVKNAITIVLLFMLLKFGWLKESRLTTPLKGWHKKWWLAALPMLLIAGLNLVSLDWALLEFSIVNFIGWSYTNISTGLFEEILLRGVCFIVLYSAWKNKENGLMRAALCQAIIFGLVHYVNLTKAPFMEVTVQVAYATLIGIGFAGLAIFTRSIWPAIAIHSIINACGSINNFFQPNFVVEEMSVANYIVVIIILGFLSALPGYILLKKSASALLSAKLAAH